MPLQQASNSQAGPSRPRQPPASFSRPKTKTIAKTTDLVARNERSKKHGAGKTGEVLGNVAKAFERSSASMTPTLSALAAGTGGSGKGKQKAVNLPGAIQVERFAEARAMEIMAFQQAIKTAAAFGNARCFQSLPRHLRRRAASHNPRRVPKRLRSRAAAEIDPNSTIAKMHRKRAKLRAKGDRQGRSRTEQLALRQRNKTWLPTHIWHAKRFHMSTLWSYRVPITPTLKSFRPAHRAARGKCAVVDASYFGVIELEGERAELLRVLQRMTAGAFAGSKFEGGSRAARVDLYHTDAFPFHFIGPAEVLWRPESSTDADVDRRIWLRLHPSIFMEVWDELKHATLPRADTSSSTTIAQTLIIRDLRGEVDSFELTGPLSGRVLKRVLRICHSEAAEKKDFYEALGHLQSTGALPEGLVAGLKVYDPRLHFPGSRLPRSDTVTTTTDGNGTLRSRINVEASADLAASDLWDEATREELAGPRYTKYDLDKRRQKQPLPGTGLRPLAQDARIPLLLLQRSISSPSSAEEAMHGFTLLLPAGWSQYLLVAFAYAGALIAGLRERQSQSREAGVPNFPEHYGSICKAGAGWADDKAKEEERRWSRKPPGKRAKWEALGTRCPFRPDWVSLIQNLAISEEEAVNAAPSDQPHFWLIREPLISLLPHIMTATDPAETLLEIVNAFRAQRGVRPCPLATRTLLDGALLHVRVALRGRGSPGDMTEIYGLSSDEIGLWEAAQVQSEEVGRVWIAGEGISAVQELGERETDPTRLFGWTNTGNFSLSRGAGHALATVTLRGYIEQVKQTLRAQGRSVTDVAGVTPLVKIRNRDGHLCRYASLSIV